MDANRKDTGEMYKLSVEVEPNVKITETIVYSNGSKLFSKFNLNYLSKSSIIIKRYGNLYHRNRYRKLMVDKLPGSRIVGDH